MNKTITQTFQQNIPDLAVQTLGSIEHLFEFCLLNNVSPTAPTETGIKFKIPEGEFETEIVNYFDSNNIGISTGAVPRPTLFEPGLFEPGLFA